MPNVRPIAGPAALTAVILLAPILASGPAAAFQVGRSPLVPACSIWLNDQGQPLRSRAGREIGRKAPCGGDSRNRDTYETLPGEARGTLVIRDSTHHVECLMVLAPGSTTVLVQKACQGYAG